MLTTLATAPPPVPADPETARTLAQLAYDSVFGHYLLDWGAAIAGLISVWRLGSKHKDGFLWGIVSCAFWVAFNTLVVSLPGIVFNLIWIAFNVRGIIRWTREHSAQGSALDSATPHGNG